MPEGLFWTTVTEFLKSSLTKMMIEGPFHEFRLVGGTSLSLQLGHRKSDDIDLFTDAEYSTVNFDAIHDFLKQSFSKVSDPLTDVVGAGKSYIISDNDNEVKLDLYYTDPFMQPELRFGPYRLASIEEIIAMKVDIVQRGARKKDFWDLHELLSNYSPAKMIELRHKRYPYHHDEGVIRGNFVDFSNTDDDLDPKCLREKHWELIKYDFVRALT